MPKDHDDLDLETPIDIEQIQDEARKSFRLTDELNQINHRSDKVTIFLDMEAVDEYRKLNSEAERINDAAGKADLKTEAGRQSHESLLERYNQLEPLVEAARAKMLSKARVIHLKGWPSIAAKVARREATKKFRDPALGRVPDDRLQEAADWIDLQLLGSSIVKIVDSTGAVDTLAPYERIVKREGKKDKTIKVDPRKTIGEQLSDQLPPSQWDRLYSAYQRLTLTDQIAQDATSDPGF